MRRMLDQHHGDRGGLFSPARIDAARFFLAHHERLRMSPTLRRVLHDAVVMDLARETMERKYGWPARSAKAIISLCLDMIAETRVVQAPRPAAKPPGQALIDHLCVPVNDPLLEQLVAGLGLTLEQARLFEIMRRAEDGFLTNDALSARLFAFAFDPPESAVVAVHISRIRAKIRAFGARIDTIYTIGFRLSVADSTILAPSPPPPKPGEVTQSEREMLDYLAVSDREMTLFHLMDRFGLNISEARMLQYLRDAPGGTMTHEVMFDRLYAMVDVPPAPDIMNVKLCTLRRKIAGSEYSIATDWGEGMRLTIATKKTVIRADGQEV